MIQAILDAGKSLAVAHVGETVTPFGTTDFAPAASPILIMNYDQARLQNEDQKGLEKEEYALLKILPPKERVPRKDTG